MDKKSKKLLNYLVEQSQPVFMFVYFLEEYSKFSGLSEDEVQACIRYLEKEEYIKIASNGHSFVLEHTALNKKEFDIIAIKKYLLSHWIAILALILSILSLLMQL